MCTIRIYRENGVTRIHTFTSALSISVYADHAPPHFHVRSANGSCQIDLRTLQVMRGRCERKDYAVVVAWASQEANMALIEAEWRRLNEQD